MSGFCGKLAVFDRRKVRQVPESFVFILLAHTSGTDICNESILNWQLRKKKKKKKKKHFGEGRRKQNKAKIKRRKSKRSETSKQIPATPTLDPPNSRPSLSPVRPERLRAHYRLKEPAQQKQRALYQHLAHPSVCSIKFLPPSPPMNLTVQNERVFNSHYVGQSLYSKQPPL